MDVCTPLTERQRFKPASAGPYAALTDTRGDPAQLLSASSSLKRPPSLSTPFPTEIVKEVDFRRMRPVRFSCFVTSRCSIPGAVFRFRPPLQIAVGARGVPGDRRCFRSVGGGRGFHGSSHRAAFSSQEVAVPTAEDAAVPRWRQGRG